jgi:probable phosphoglycerate mutase
MEMTRFWLIRHGETDWNAQQRLQGWRDIALNAYGLKQAGQLAGHLSSPRFSAAIDTVVSSDLSRACETARIAAAHLGLPLLCQAQLRERNYGIYEGRDWPELKRQAAEPNVPDFHDPDQPIEQGESLRAFHTRIVDAFEALAHSHSGRSILVFTHGGVIDMVWKRARQLALDTPRPAPILNTSINQFAIDRDGGWHLTDWGRVDHLDAGTLDDVG